METTPSFRARVAIVHRSFLTVLTDSGEQLIPSPPGVDITVGDWLLVEHETFRVIRVLERKSLIARIAAGREPRPQSIAANVDTLFVVTSCNEDFNLSRLERYLALAFDARVTPVIVLTKADLCTDVEVFISAAQSIASGVSVVTVDATDAPVVLATLRPWLTADQTVAFVGSSGVGKSTLVNALLGASIQATATIREDDAKGRHTTTARFLLRAPDGFWLIDTPGMRELRIGGVTSGVSKAFADVETLAKECRFRDCQHGDDVGCALRAAIAAGHLELRRLDSYLKLGREA